MYPSYTRELLQSLSLAGKINSIIIGPWQTRVRQEIAESKNSERYTKIIGPVDMEKVQEFKLWLSEHSKRPEILF
jgi:hypothetical protein